MSWNDFSSTSQPPVSDFGVPTSSPLTACQLASPMICQPVSADPVKVQSGLKVVGVADNRTINAIDSAPRAPTRTRLFMTSPLSRYEGDDRYDDSYQERAIACQPS